eukprot:XP_027304164.1 homer protein homolog 1-like [Anas platyrhynchos]
MDNIWFGRPECFQDSDSNFIQDTLEAKGLKIAPEKVQRKQPWLHLGWNISDSTICPQKVDITTVLRNLTDVQIFLGNIQWGCHIVRITNDDLAILLPLLQGRSAELQITLTNDHRQSPSQIASKVAAGSAYRCIAEGALSLLESAGGDIQSPLTPESINGTDDERVTPEVMQNLDPRAEPTQNVLPFTHSSTVSKHWEAELATLKGNNAKLTAALLESTANVKQWKQQLAAYQEEAERLHKRVTELECVSSQANVVHTHKTELNQTIQEFESTLKKKEEEIERLKQEIDSSRDLQAQRGSLTQKLQEVEIRNKDLEGQLSDLEQRLEKSQNEQEAFHNNLKTLLENLDGKIFELTELRDNLAKLIECS